MTILSKEEELQNQLSTLFEELIVKKEKIRKELVSCRKQYNYVCDLHISNGFQDEHAWIEASDEHQHKFLEYDTHCFLIDILTDYRDIEGFFPEYDDMLANIEELMLKFAHQERYEVSAIIKVWHSRFTQAAEVLL